MRGDLPADLHAFTHVNTDVGAWQLGRRGSRRSSIGKTKAPVLPLPVRA